MLVFAKEGHQLTTANVLKSVRAAQEKNTIGMVAQPRSMSIQ